MTYLKKIITLTCLLCHSATAITAQTIPVKIWETVEPTNQKGLYSVLGAKVFDLINEKNTFIYASIPNEFRQDDFGFWSNSLNKYDIETGKKLGSITFQVNTGIHSVKVDPLGNVYILRIGHYKSPFNKAYLSKYSFAGEQVWEKELYPDPEKSCSFFNMSFDVQGRIILCGSHYYKENFIFARCFRPDGWEVWHTKIPTEYAFDGYPQCSAAIINNKLTMFFKRDAVHVVEVDMNGNVVKQSLALNVDPDGRVNKIMRSGEALQYSDYPTSNYKVNKLDRNGNIVWERMLLAKTLTNAAAGCIAKEDVFSDGDIYIAALLYFLSNGGTRTDSSVMAIAKLSKNGDVQWQQRHRLPNVLYGNIQDIALDRQYVYSAGAATERGLVNIFDKTTGQLVYNLQVTSDAYEGCYKILPIPGGFIYGGNRIKKGPPTPGTFITNENLLAVIARYRLPTVTTAEAKLTNNITLYPNPTTRHLTIENIDAAQFNTAELWDSSGRLLLSSPVTDTTLHWQPEVLPPGTYQVVLHGSGGRLTKQVIVMSN